MSLVATLRSCLRKIHGDVWQNQYRRVGRTCFLAYATDETHPSRSLSIDNDVEEHEFNRHFDEQPRLDAERITQHVEAMRNSSGGTEALDDPSCPLHVMIAATRLDLPVPDIAQKIRGAYSRDPSSIHLKDENGFTPLHLAATFANFEAVQALLSLPPDSGIFADLHLRNNSQGLTPLEACEREMRNLREFSETLLGTWKGHSVSALRIVYLLKRAAGEEIQGSEDDFIAGSRWGCTCGQCTDGWLSSRMRYRLLSSSVSL